jgi:hypothetical protein
VTSEVLHAALKSFGASCRSAFVRIGDSIAKHLAHAICDRVLTDPVDGVRAPSWRQRFATADSVGVRALHQPEAHGLLYQQSSSELGAR